MPKARKPKGGTALDGLKDRGSRAWMEQQAKKINRQNKSGKK